jgi:hypothetical protein
MFLAALLSLGTGCRTTSCPTLQSPIGPNWRIQSGQAIWQPGPNKPELAGELMLASGPAAECYLEFAKTPLTLVVAIRDQGRWSVKFAGAERAYSGRGKPPSRIAWLHLPQALMGEKLPSAFEFEQAPDGYWRLRNKKTGEVLKGFLLP